MRLSARFVLSAFLVLSLVGCLNRSPSPTTQAYTVGGSVSGLLGGQQLVLKNNGGDALTVTSNGSFSFPTPASFSESYLVTVATQPAGETCTVANYQGSTVVGNVSNVAVTCSVNTYSIGGTVTGLSSGAQLTLNDNGGDPIAVASNGTFQFAAVVAYNGSYNVTVAAQPTGQTCTVANGAGSGVVSSVTNVSVLCSNNTFTVGGTVTGLTGGQIMLRNNGSDALTVAANGGYTFNTAVAYNGAYNVTVATQPTGQTCTVANGAGLATATNITNVAVTCSTNHYTIRGTVSGLAGRAQVTLNDNGGDPVIVAANGSFSFATPVAYGGSYAVTAGTQPVGQTCTVTNASGSGVSAEVSNVAVTCATNNYTVGGAVTGLSANGLVLKNNAGDPIAVGAGSSSFVFDTPVAYNSSYVVTVFQQPLGQTCMVANGAGSNVQQNVANVSVSCTTSTYTVGGTVSGLLGTLVLQNNGADNTTISSNGSVTFPTPIVQGSSYNVTVLMQPAAQTCTVSNSSGTIGGSNITNIAVICTTSVTTLSANVSELALSVTGLTEYGVTGTPSSGVARTITITNTGLYPAMNLAVTNPTWPTGTTSSTTCGSTLAAAASCTITVTPGSTPTSTCGATAPVPGDITVAAVNSSTVTTAVTVLGYGCLYQGGYVFAFDDTTPVTGSVGGKVVATTDQSTSIVWSSDGSGGSAFDPIYGINDTSTTATPSPSSGQVSGQTACNGATDGLCDTNNIYTYYQNHATNAPINLSSYAAGVCKQTISGYSDWYLPAACELGYDNSCGSSSTPMTQNMRSGLQDQGFTSILNGYYWSSTQPSVRPMSYAWAQYLSSSTVASGFATKNSSLSARCARSLSY